MALTTINSGGVKDDSIVNADIKSDAAIAGSKISPDFGSQNIVTTGTLGSSDITLTKPGSAANAKLEIKQSGGGGGTSEILFSDATSGRGRIFFNHGSNPEVLNLEAAGTIGLSVTTAGKIGIGTTSPGNPLHVRNTTTDLLKLDCNDAGALGAHLQLNHDSSSPADDDVVGAIEFAGKDSNGNGTIYSRIRGVALDVTDGTEDGALVFGTRVDASFGERMRINGANVGIGTSSPGQKLSVNGAIDATDYRVLADNANVSFYLTTPSDFRFRTTSGTERARILSTGGLTFNGDTAAANALDDYEEGSWSPTVSSGGTAFTVTGSRYVKIGAQVTLWFDITNGSGSGTNNIYGLPFTPTNVHGNWNIGYYEVGNATTSEDPTHHGGFVDYGTPRLSCRVPGGSVGWTIADSTRLIGCAVYWTTD